MKLQTISAHPDDVEALAGGTIAKAHRLGWEIGIVVVSDGAAGGSASPEIMRQIRRREAETAARLIGADFRWLGLPDTAIYHNPETLDLIINAIRGFKPDIVLSHLLRDAHRDHQTTARLVDEATYMVSVPNRCLDTPPCPSPKVWGMEPFWGVDFNTKEAEYVELKPEDFDLKMAMIECHQSQIKWLREHDGIDLLAMVENKTKFRGAEAGVPLAEIFVRFPHWPMPTRRWLP